MKFVNKSFIQKALWWIIPLLLITAGISIIKINEKWEYILLGYGIFYVGVLFELEVLRKLFTPFEYLFRIWTLIFIPFHWVSNKITELIGFVFISFFIFIGVLILLKNQFISTFVDNNFSIENIWYLLFTLFLVTYYLFGYPLARHIYRIFSLDNYFGWLPLKSNKEINFKTHITNFRLAIYIVQITALISIYGIKEDYLEEFKEPIKQSLITFLAIDRIMIIYNERRANSKPIV